VRGIGDEPTLPLVRISDGPERPLGEVPGDERDEPDDRDVGDDDHDPDPFDRACPCRVGDGALRRLGADVERRLDDDRDHDEEDGAERHEHEREERDVAEREAAARVAEEVGHGSRRR